MKINIHSHSHYSDGANLFEMAKEHQKEGFSAFVVTDHVCPLSVGNAYSLSIQSYEKFQQQTSELENISKELNFPCLQGIELALYEEEILIFGEKATRKIFEFIDNMDLNEKKKYGQTLQYKQKIITHLLNIVKQNRNDTATVLCHPNLVRTPQWELTQIYEIIDGYEFQNGNRYRFTDETNIDKKLRWDRAIPDELKLKNKFYNSDAHNLSSVTKSEANFHSLPITSIDDLISYIKTPQQNNLLLLRHQNIISR